MKKEPQFLDCGGCTVRVNPPACPTCMLCLQIMEPPVFNETGYLQAPGTFTQLYITREQAKAIADTLYAQLAMDLVE